MLIELELRKNFLGATEITTIYLGGGTPSILSFTELNRIFSTIQKNYNLIANAEITLESNPDDLSIEYLKSLKEETIINRLSIGVQSFNDIDLKFMNRAHSSKQAHECLQNAKVVGFNNITADLIFGCQTTTDIMWRENLETMISFELPHLSIYGLSIEENTALHHFVSAGKVAAQSDLRYIQQFTMTQDFLEGEGYEQYEISNYTKLGHQSIHNTNYWNNVPYLGIGPSAHSFDGSSRFWNVSNNSKYIKALECDERFYTSETLTATDLYNEMILTQLRRKEGIPKKEVDQLDQRFRYFFEAGVNVLMEKDELTFDGSSYFIPRHQKTISDRIMQDLFYINSDNDH